MSEREPSGGRLTPERMLRLLREVAGVLRGGTEPREALVGVAEMLVPEVATRVTIYAVDNDGRLHALGRAGTVPAPPVPVGTGADFEESGPGKVRSLSNRDDHPVALACREGIVTWKASGEDGSHRLDELATRGTPICQVAVPIRRDQETVGVLDLEVDGVGDTTYDADDLDLLSHLGDELSLGLESLRLRRDVETARRAKADFLAVMSHELRTPLTAVVGYADLLAAGIPGPIEERQVQHLERIKESAWELLALIDGILGFARHEGEEVELLVSMVEPVRIVDEALAAVRAEMRDKGLELSVDVPEDLPAIRTDRSRAVEILRHLLSNAAKFTEEGEVRLEAWLERDWVVFEISDTGSGIPEYAIDRIFEPFWQGEKVETRTKGGAGLGLSLAARFAELLSAEISVESEKGEGSTFTVRLPREGPHPTFP